MRKSRWTPETLAELGKLYDREVAAITGLTVGTVRERRSRERIAPRGRDQTPLSPELADFPTLDQITRTHIVRALELTDGNRCAAARALAIDRWRLAREMRRLGMIPPRPLRRSERVAEPAAGGLAASKNGAVGVGGGE